MTKFHLLNAAKGAAMGVAEVIPGVSGGTIAFITGIYERLINAIKAIGPGWLKGWRESGFAGFWKAADGVFLVSLVGGMVGGIVVGVFVVTHLLETYPLLVWSYFFGLILVSTWLVGRQIDRWSVAAVVAALAGAGLAYFITIAVPTTGNPALWFVMLCGAVAVSALLLPGISGSFVLLLLGMYGHVMGSLKGFLQGPNMENISVIVVFAIGMLVGMTLFSRVISWTFSHYRNATLAGLAGFLPGSLNKIWPWQEVLITETKASGETAIVMSKSVLPSHFATLENNFLYGNEPQVMACIALMLAGIATVAVVEWAASRAIRP